MWLRRTDPTGVSNDSMGAAPRHPFLSRVIDHLGRYAHSWLLPYLTVMLSTGPLFFSVMWKEYIWSHPGKGQEVRVLLPEWYVVVVRKSR
jgi:inositol phosphorylceramide mannosyltransferase catalytic subunit